jgi:hypothetical protein
MDSFSTFPFLDNTSAQNTLPPREGAWMMKRQQVGHLKHASMIKSFPGMEDVQVKENVLLHIMWPGIKDVFDNDAAGCIPVDNIGDVLGYRGMHWDKCVSRLEQKLENGYCLRHVPNGHPKVR